MRTLQKRVEKLEATKVHSDPSLYFRLNDWVDSRLMPDTQTALEAAALDRLIAAGKIRVEDRSRVRWIVRVFVSPSPGGAKLVEGYS